MQPIDGTTGSSGKFSMLPRYTIWNSPTTPMLIDFGEIDIQLIGTPLVPYVLEKSLNNSEYFPVSVFSGNQCLPNLKEAGLYWVSGPGYYRFSPDGQGSTIVIRPW